MINNHKRTLVCVIAQTRDHKLTWTNFNKYVVKTLNADLAICVSKDKNYNFNNSYYKNSKYRWFCKDYKDFAEAFDYAQKKIYLNSTKKKPNWRKVKIIRDHWLGGIRGPKKQVGSAGISMFFRWLLLNNLKKSGIINKYDRFIVTRGDLFWVAPHTKLSSLNENYIWIPDGEYYGGFNDRHAVLSKQNVTDYLNIINPILSTPSKLVKSMKNYEHWSLEKYLKFYLEKIKYKKKVKFFPHLMFLVRRGSTPTNSAYSIYSKKHKYYIKYPTEYISANIYKQITKNKNHSLNLTFNKFIFKIHKFFIKVGITRKIWFKIFDKKKAFDSQIVAEYYKKRRLF